MTNGSDLLWQKALRASWRATLLGCVLAVLLYAGDVLTRWWLRGRWVPFEDWFLLVTSAAMFASFAAALVSGVVALASLLQQDATERRAKDSLKVLGAIVTAAPLAAAAFAMVWIALFGE